MRPPGPVYMLSLWNSAWMLRLGTMIVSISLKIEALPRSNEVVISSGSSLHKLGLVTCSLPLPKLALKVVPKLLLWLLGA